MQKLCSKALAAYSLCSAALAIHLGIIYASKAITLRDFVDIGPLTDQNALLVSLSATWFLTGVLLVLIRFGFVKRTNVFLWGTFFVVALFYVNAMRERVAFGDFFDFVQAAIETAHGEPLHQRYLYPPMLASFLSMFYTAGMGRAVVLLCFFANIFSLWLFFLLATLFLRRCGLSLNLAAMMVFLGTILNVPVLRNMGYLQVNLLLADLILASILLYPRFPILSGFFLALGVHLKVVPIVFAPLFLYIRKPQWAVSFAVTCIGVVLLTSAKDGFHYYVNFLQNIREWSAYTSLYSVSIDSFLSRTSWYLTGYSEAGEWLSACIRYVLIAFSFTLAFVSIRRRSFVTSPSSSSDRIVNGAIPLFFLSAIVPTALWTYHLVLLIIPVLVLTLALHSRWQLCLFSIGYYLTFVIPAFGFYPWSSVTCIGWLILYGMVAAAILGRWRGSWYRALDREVEERLAMFRIGENLT